MARSLGIHTIRGKGVTRESLLDMIREVTGEDLREIEQEELIPQVPIPPPEEMGPYERMIYEENTEFYKAILPYIDTLPDFRPEKTVQQMRKVEIDGKLVPPPQDKTP